MNTRPHYEPRPSGASRIEALVPGVCGWATWRGALTNLLLFGVTALGAEWLVHQIQYRIEYGQHFATVMAAAPHHAYMQPLGSVLATLTSTLVFLGALVLGSWLAGNRGHPGATARDSRPTAADGGCLRFHDPLDSVLVIASRP
ncbi:MAG: hypothetical protein ACR2JC_08500 [Chloroflexota bacterium]